MKTQLFTNSFVEVDEKYHIKYFFNMKKGIHLLFSTIRIIKIFNVY